MKLEEVLPPGSVLLDVSVSDKARVIAQVAALLAMAAGVSRQAVETALLGREALGSTGVGGGVALPHARLHILTETHAVCLRLSEPIAFDSIDQKPVDLVCAVVAPDEPNAELLTALGAMSRALRDGARTTEFRSAIDPADARRILLGA